MLTYRLDGEKEKTMKEENRIIDDIDFADFIKKAYRGEEEISDGEWKAAWRFAATEIGVYDDSKDDVKEDCDQEGVSYDDIRNGGDTVWIVNTLARMAEEYGGWYAETYLDAIRAMNINTIDDVFRFLNAAHYLSMNGCDEFYQIPTSQWDAACKVLGTERSVDAIRTYEDLQSGYAEKTGSLAWKEV